MDLMGKFSISASMLLTGFAIVFGVLVLLIFIIWLYGTIVSSAQNKTLKRKQQKEIETLNKLKSSEPVPAQKAPDPIVNTTEQSGIPEEIVAVIAAAVYSVYGSKQKVKIKSIKRSKRRSEWAKASALENTQPF